MGTLYVTEQGARLEKEYGRYIVVDEDQVIFSVPAVRVDHVVLVGRSGVTTPAMHSLLDQGIGLTLISRTGNLRGHLTAATGKNIALRHRQYTRAQDPRFCLDIGRSIALGKLRNYRTLTRRIARGHPVEHAAIEHITAAILSLQRAEDLAAIRAQEGRGTKAYFGVLRQALSDHLDFAARSRRPPRDHVNALMSLGYSLLTQNLFTACEIAGLDPYDGFLHADKYGKPALALDLMEEFRGVIVDSVVMNLVNRKRLVADDFSADPGGGIRLSSRGLRTFIHAYGARIHTAVMHRPTGRRLSYLKICEYQAWQLRRFIEGASEGYEPFLTR